MPLPLRFTPAHTLPVSSSSSATTSPSPGQTWLCQPHWCNPRGTIDGGVHADALAPVEGLVLAVPATGPQPDSEPGPAPGSTSRLACRRPSQGRRLLPVLPLVAVVARDAAAEAYQRTGPAERRRLAELAGMVRRPDVTRVRIHLDGGDAVAREGRPGALAPASRYRSSGPGWRCRHPPPSGRCRCRPRRGSACPPRSLHFLIGDGLAVRSLRCWSYRSQVLPSKWLMHRRANTRCPTPWAGAPSRWFHGHRPRPCRPRRSTARWRNSRPARARPGTRRSLEPGPVAASA